jgi:hypothetical protein
MSFAMKENLAGSKRVLTQSPSRYASGALSSHIDKIEREGLRPCYKTEKVIRYKS